MPRSRMPLAALLAGIGAAAAAQDALQVVTWGGAYEAAQRDALFDPFAAKTGLTVDVLTYDGSLDGLRARAATEGWDVIDMLEDQAIAACEAGLLVPLDHAALAGPGARADFAPFRLRRCSLPQNVFATVMAYDDRAFPGLKPKRIEDFFDTARFPGRRAVQRGPDGILEWALMAEGVPPAQVYDLLSTDRGLRLAFRKLDTIRDDIVWWDRPDTPARLLARGDAAMASGYNGRFFSAAQGGAPISIVWDGRLIGLEVWAIPRTADDAGAARRFLAYAADPAPMARLAERIPYGPARRSAFDRIGLHPDTATPMRDHLPNAPQHGARALVRDSVWHAHTSALRRRRFEAWLARDGPPDGGG